MPQIKIFLLLPFLVGFCSPANILAIFPVPSQSHFYLGHYLMKQLADREHNVTFVSPYKQHANHTNIRFVKMEGLYGTGSDFFGFLEKEQLSSLDTMISTIYDAVEMTNSILSHPKMQEVLNSSEKFDLLMLDMHLSDSLLGIANHFKIPTVVFSSSGTRKLADEMVRNPVNPSYNPNNYLGYTDNMSLKQRLVNTIITIFDEISYKTFYLPAQEKLYQRYFKPLLSKDEQLPDLIDLIHNVSLVLLNSHPVLQYPRAFVPNAVQIGGFHMTTDDNEMDPAIYDYMEKAPGGCVYVSLGSNMRSADLPEEVIDMFVNVFTSMKRVLFFWKFESTVLKERHTGNLFIGPWLPQQEILAHANTRAFISQGGHISTMESVYYGKPMIVMPFFNEHKSVAARSVEQGFAHLLDYSNISETSIREALEAVINQTSYKQNVVRLSKLFRDNPQDPLEKTINYIEHVIKTEGAPHLRTVATKLSFFQLHLVDVYLIVFAVLALIALIPFYIVRAVLRWTHRLASEKDLKKVKKLESIVKRQKADKIKTK